MFTHTLPSLRSILPTRRALALAALATVSAGCVRAAPAGKMPDRMAIAASIAPGKPGAPVETISVSYEAAKASITVKRGEPGAEETKETAALTVAEADDLWQIANANRLVEFAPKPVKGATFDFGERTLKLDFRVSAKGKEANDGKTYNSVSWTSSISNESAVKPMLSALSSLAAKHCKKTPLYYFP
jgi:hypothetical protein